MPVLRLFAAAREAAGEARLELGGGTVGDVLDEARRRYGEAFTAVLARSRVWVNGQPADEATELREQDVVAILPPVSGGAGARAGTAGTERPAVTLPEPPPAVPETPRTPSRPFAPPVPARAPEPGPGLVDVPEAEPLDAGLTAAEPPAVPGVPAPAAMEPPAIAPLPAAMEPPAIAAPPSPPPPPPPPLGSGRPAGPEPEPPPAPGVSADELLDRLAGLPPWQEDQSWYPEEPEPADLPEPREEEFDDSLWGPGSGPVWSVGDPDRRQRRRDRADWTEEQQPPPPEPPGRAGASPFAPGEQADQPGRERRWDVSEWDRPGERAPEASLSPKAPPAPRPPASPASRPPGPPGPAPDIPRTRPTASGRPAPLRPAPPAPAPPGIDDDEPAVRILGPGPFPGRAEDGRPEAGPKLAVVPPAVAARSSGRVRADGVAVTERPAARPAPALVRAGSAAAVAAAAAPDLAAKPAPRPRPPLAVVPRSTRPHGRLGFLWVVLTVVAIVWSPVTGAVWLALCAGLAGIQTAKVWQARNEKPLVLLAGATAAALPLCALEGLRGMTGGVALAVVVTLLARAFSLTKAPARDVALTLAIGVVVGLAVASVVLLRNTGLHAPLLLLAFAAAYDAGAYLVGTGASAAWEGPAAGIATLIPVTMLSAVVLVPPFPEGSPLLLGVLAAILAPCGPPAGSVLLGERDANAPALRRLDSLLVMAPVWAWCAAAFLR